MGNRAVIAFEDKPTAVGLYLHWNGGRDSVEPILAACKELGIRAPGSDPAYAMARLAQVVGNYFGGVLSLGINTLDKLDCDNGDNGVYILGENWEIVSRKHYKGDEQKGHDFDEMKAEILKANQAVFAK